MCRLVVAFPSVVSLSRTGFDERLSQREHTLPYESCALAALHWAVAAEMMVREGTDALERACGVHSSALPTSEPGMNSGSA